MIAPTPRYGAPTEFSAASKKLILPIAQQIFKRFIQTHAPQEINVPESLRSQIEHRFIALNEVQAGMFDATASYILTLLRHDIFSRFLKRYKGDEIREGHKKIEQYNRERKLVHWWKRGAVGAVVPQQPQLENTHYVVQRNCQVKWTDDPPPKPATLARMVVTGERKPSSQIELYRKSMSLVEENK